jgi:shikimate dehydrogenase
LYDYLSDKSHSLATLHFYELNSPKSDQFLKIADLIINCTPVGMWPDVKGDIIPNYTPFPNQWMFDLVYNPLETVFVKKAQKLGCNIISGLEMLIYQAAEAFKWWTGIVPDVRLMRKVAIDSLNSIFSI